MTEREALKLALEALKHTHPSALTSFYTIGDRDKAIKAIKEHLAQPEQEPDYYGLTADHLWMSISKDHYDRLKPEYRMTCYTTPPQRKPLTDEEIGGCIDEVNLMSQYGHHHFGWHKQFARAIEAAHGIKELA